MTDPNTIIFALVTFLATGGIGYYLSFRFWNSTYAGTNKRGDFGGPRGGVFALMSGVMIGIFFFAIFGKAFFTPELTEVGMMASMIGGAIGGITAAFRSLYFGNKKDS